MKGTYCITVEIGGKYDLKKKLTALLLALSMLPTLMAGCKPNTSDDGNTSDPGAESSRPEQTEQPNQPAAADYDTPELIRAAEYGFVSAKLRSKDVGDAITYREYCAMITENEAIMKCCHHRGLSAGRCTDAAQLLLNCKTPHSVLN